MATQQEQNLIDLLDGYVEKGGHQTEKHFLMLKHILKNILN